MNVDQSAAELNGGLPEGLPDNFPLEQLQMSFSEQGPLFCEFGTGN